MRSFEWNLFLDRHLPKTFRDLINGFVPGLIKEPIPVRVRSRW